MHDDEPEEPWVRALLAGLAALGAAAVIVGVVVGVMVVAALRIGGVGDGSPDASGPGSLYMPPYQKTPEVETETGPPAERPRVSAIPLDPTDGPTAALGKITLYANPTVVSSGQRVDLNGVYLDGEGVSLQVQRREGDAWIDFPTSATVRSGAFGTYIYTGRSGKNVFRVFDPTTGRASNSVTVTVG